MRIFGWRPNAKGQRGEPAAYDVRASLRAKLLAPVRCTVLLASPSFICLRRFKTPARFFARIIHLGKASTIARSPMLRPIFDLSPDNQEMRKARCLWFLAHKR